MPLPNKGHRRKPALYYNVKTPDGWRYYPAPDGLDSEIVAQQPGGRLMVRERIADGRRVYSPVKPDETAKHALQRAKERGWDVQWRRSTSRAHGTLKTQIRAFLEHYSDRQMPEARKKAAETMTLFQESCPKIVSARYVSQADVFAFHEYLRQRGNAPRTIANHHKRVRVFLKWAKVDVDAVMPKTILPRYEQQEPTVYSSDEITSLLEHSDAYTTLVIEMGRQLGLREREMMFATFDNILPNRTYRVQGKPEMGFTIKTYEQRDIPLSSKLHTLLTQWKDKRPDTKLILGTGEFYRTPNRQLLPWLKTVAKKAGVKDATLHRFRRTAITAWLRSGMDIKTCQRFAGHKSLDATLRYLRALDAEKMVHKVDALFG